MNNARVSPRARMPGVIIHDATLRSGRGRLYRALNVPESRVILTRAAVKPCRLTRSILKIRLTR